MILALSRIDFKNFLNIQFINAYRWGRVMMLYDEFFRFFTFYVEKNYNTDSIIYIIKIIQIIVTFTIILILNN
jgi:hypothetical protein